jgi:hypothetical protein
VSASGYPLATRTACLKLGQEPLRVAAVRAGGPPRSSLLACERIRPLVHDRRVSCLPAPTRGAPRPAPSISAAAGDEDVAMLVEAFERR